MRRWFRRKGKAEEKSGENGAAPLVEETEPSSEAAERAGEASPIAAEALAAESGGPVAPEEPTPGRRASADRHHSRRPESSHHPLGEAGPDGGRARSPGGRRSGGPRRSSRSSPPEAVPAPAGAAEPDPGGPGWQAGAAFPGRKVVDAELLEDLEELLITADLGVETSLFLIQALQDKLRRRELADVERLKAALQAEMVDLLTGPAPEDRSAHPWVVLVVGVNGVGKTTTIAKLAHQDRHQGLTPMLVAGDTFRAAAVEQLEIWGERVGAAVVKQKTGADPAAVVFDGLAAADRPGRGHGVRGYRRAAPHQGQPDGGIKKDSPNRGQKNPRSAPMKCCSSWTPPRAKTP